MIVGAGLNGLAAAILLARAGWRVLVLESQPEPGGALRTAEVTLPGFRHDLYATNLNAFAGSAFHAHLGPELRDCGFELVRAARAFCSLFPDGDLLGVSASLGETLADIGRLSPRDAEAWSALVARFDPRVLAVLRQPMPSWGLLKGWRLAGLAVESSGSFVREHFRHPKLQALWAVWGMHLDFPPHIAGGALYPYLSCMLAQAHGLGIGKGGARNLVDSLVGLLRASGGELRCSSEVSRIIVEQGVATGVVAGREEIKAKRAVIANLAPSVLFRLLEKPLTSRRYRYAPGSLMIHLALSDLPDWRDPRARQFLYVHIAPSLDAMSRTYRQALSGELPEEPVLIVAQPTVADPSRAPAGKHVLSIQVRVVPPAMAMGKEAEAYADRILGLLERYAPGLGQKILGRHVISPADLERANPNLVGGDSLGGSHHLDQQFVFRPFLGWSRYRTPLKRLYMCGASTWPGAGSAAGSGWLLGNMLIERKGA